MKFQAHRGVTTEFPENTLPAFEAAARQGYDYIELDPTFTSDSICVVLHDETLNRTCRYSNGEKLEKDVKISEITYEQSLKYDAGIAKSFKFRGTKIPLLSDVLKFAKKSGVTVKIDNKVQNFSDIQTEIFYDIVEKSGAEVAFTCNDIEYIKKVASRFPNAEIHYDGFVDEKHLKEIKNILCDKSFTVWLCLKSQMTAWFTLPSADVELCSMVKKYAKLGLWLLYNDEQLRQAVKFGVDIIETTGVLKPEKIIDGAVNCHSHTECSHDSNCVLSDSIKSAKQNGLFAFAVTDHCDIEFCKTSDVKTPILNSVKNAKSYGDYVLAGVEICEMFWYNDVTDDIISSADFDIVIGSVHAVGTGRYTMPFSTIDFSKFTENDIEEYLTHYFEDMYKMVEECDFDVLAHLTNPLKYITGKYGIKVDLSKYSQIIDSILKTIIIHGKALEINTACIGSDYNEFMPEKSVIARYRALGGYLLTLGTDSHTADRMANGIKEAVEFLKTLGFKNLYYFKNRIPIQYSLSVL